MTVEESNWARVKELLDRASKLPVEERRSFLDDVCGDDEDLKNEVWSYLAIEDEMGSFIGDPYFERRAESGAMLERRIGPYRLLELLGSGGMGEVYLAERVDQEFEQRVAVKLVRGGADGGEIGDRFRHERQILANLEHPYIARLLDGGTFDHGRPYFVMEHVEGQPIDEYCENLGLDVDARLDLFEKVCEAVQFAHRRLVVHRDLKPANILVDTDGVPKLLDFGIAKVLDPEVRGPETELVRPLTRAYASPEQIRGEAVTTASDVYSLGVLLYELLTGHRPFKEDGAGEPLTPISGDQVPVRPSSVLSRPRPRGAAVDGEEQPEPAANPVLRRRLSGDLDHIVLMALRFEADLRYGSVQELLDDLERFRQGRPVAARKGSLSYRVGKFGRRNSGRLVLAGVGFSLLTSLGWIQVQQKEVEQERLLAVRESKKADELGEFVVRIWGRVPPETSEDFTNEEQRIRREFWLEQLDRAREETEDLEDPGARAAMWGVIGRSYRLSGFFDDAELAQRNALSIRRMRGDYPGREYAVALSLNNLAITLRQQDRYQETARYLRIAEEVPLGDGILERRLRARILSNLAGIEKQLGNLERAVPIREEALSLRLDLQRDMDAELDRDVSGEERPIDFDEDDARQVKLEVAVTRVGLAADRRSSGKPEDAKKELVTAIRLLEEFGDEEERVANARRHLAGVHLDLGELDLARIEYDRSSNVFEDGRGMAHQRRAWEIEGARLAAAEGDVRSARSNLCSAIRPRHQRNPDSPRLVEYLGPLAEIALQSRDEIGAWMAAAEVQRILGANGLSSWDWRGGPAMEVLAGLGVVQPAPETDAYATWIGTSEPSPEFDLEKLCPR
ncbi:MAG: serine/threonine-protein kinase [Acidobacteriota bacterium]